MAISGGESEEIKSINITPMVDIMLVLLVIFMVTANFLKKESININLPKADSADPNVSESVQVAMTKQGELLLDGEKINPEALSKSLLRKSKIRPNMRVTLSGDETLPYGKIASIMGVIRKAGITRIALSVKR